MTKAELLEQLRDARNNAVQPECFESFDAAVCMAEKLDDSPMLQMGKDGMLHPVPMPVQQEPSPLEVVMRLVEMQGVQWKKLEDTVQDAFKIIAAVRAEEARRAGK